MTMTPPAVHGTSSLFGAERAVWRVDPADSRARFTAATLWGRVQVSGDLGKVSGELEWHGTSGDARLRIAAAGLSSGLALRDRHLRSREFFDVSRHPEIIFDAQAIAPERGAVQIAGRLWVRGQGHDFVCEAAATVLEADRITLETRATFDLDELGMSRGLLHMLPASVTAQVRVVLQRDRA